MMSHPLDESSSSGCNDSNKDAFIFQGEFTEQIDIFSYSEVDVPYIDEQLCRDSAGWYSQRDLNEAKLLLRFLKESGEPLTKLQLARLRYPKIFRMRSTGFTDPEGKRWDIATILQNKYVEKVGRLLRSISDNINRKLDDLNNDISQKVAFLKSVSLAIQIDQDEMGRALYVYQGPDWVQPLNRRGRWLPARRYRLPPFGR